LTEAQIAALFDAPTEQREPVRHYTLSAADPAAWAVIRRLFCNWADLLLDGLPRADALIAGRRRG
jgi:hypothetical protein